MNRSEAKDLVLMIVNAFPRQEIQQTTIAIYEKSLMDFTPSEGARAVSEAITTSRWFPTVAELREFVMEERLQLDSPHAAWERVLSHLAWKSPGDTDCGDCDGMGYQRADEGQSCRSCGGRGKVPIGSPPSLDVPTRRAFDLVGGRAAMRTSDNPAMLRAQFIKAYMEFRDETLRDANRDSLDGGRKAALVAGDRPALRAVEE